MLILTKYLEHPEMGARDSIRGEDFLMAQLQKLYPFAGYNRKYEVHFLGQMSVD